MPNSFVVQFQRNIVDEPLPYPPILRLVGGFMPGGKPQKPARGAIKNLPSRSWLGPKKSSKRAKRRSSLGTLMGR
jgi:hypothetical protein